MLTSAGAVQVVAPRVNDKHLDDTGERRRFASAWIRQRGAGPGRLFTGQRGPLSVSGMTQVVLAVGADAKLAGLRPHRLRHTYATRLRRGGADPAQVQALLGHTSIESTARCFRAGAAERAAVVERVFGE